MKSLTSLVFYTNVVLKVVILNVRLNLVLEALSQKPSSEFGNQKERFCKGL